MNPLEGKLLFPFIAPPNGGKGTQTNALCTRFNMPKIDMGAILRQIGKEDTELARQVRERQANGQLVETPVVLEALKEGLKKLAEKNPDVKGYILDGFPRNSSQVDGLVSLCKETGAIVAKAFYLKVPDSAIMTRAVNRRICPVGGEIYNLLSKPPKTPGICDVHGVALDQRNDDKPEKVQERLRSFQEDTRPIVKRFRELELLEKVDGDRPEELITQDLVTILQPFFDLTPA
jgi:adenylate kinase